MTAIIIILSVLMLFTLVFTFPIVVRISYIDSDFQYKITYAGIPLFPREPSKRRRKPKKAKKRLKLKKSRVKKAKKQENIIKSDLSDKQREEKPEDKKEATKTISERKSEKAASSPKARTSEKSESKTGGFFEENVSKLDGLKDKLEMIFSIIRASKKGVRRVLKGIYFTDVDINFTVADEDAYECAMKYGRINAYLCTLLGLVKGYFGMRAKRISVACRYNSSDSVYDFSFKLKIRLGTAVFSILSIFINYLINNNKEDEEKQIKPVKGYAL